ncbi:uncharacterized protein LOC131680853 [Topomyia yanbarensis]|uniref:uncharacterized protein LOC131680853 n=1 Tax=Topomyia yanbarensis TaxID=2498891 RepID=UPI00273A7B00|nr:uncharacterized protein LOC131680853 [Topomyia yanbarensis]
MVKTSGNTQNLWKHLDRHHPLISVTLQKLPPKTTPKNAAADVEENSALGDEKTDIVELPNSKPSQVARAITISESFTRVSSFGGKSRFNCFYFSLVNFKIIIQANGSSTIQLHEALMYMVAKDNLPLRTVERSGFLRFCKSAVPLYKLPSRRTLTRMLNNKFEVQKDAVREHLSAVDNYSLTADVWTDSCNNVSFLGMTVHYLNGNVMQSIALVARPLEGSHTKEHLAAEIHSLCTEWWIDVLKISVFVTDGGANIVAAAKAVVGEKRHFVCVDHTLSRMTTVAIENSPLFDELLIRIRGIVTYFKRSVNAADALRSIQRKMANPKARY